MNIFNSDLFGLYNKQPLPSNGDLIIAEPFLADGIFTRSVIYIADHCEKSSMGIIMNHTTEFYLNDAIQGIYKENIPLYYGGPTSNDRLFFIHTIGDMIPDSTEINNGIFINGNLKIIKEYINSGEPVDGKIRFFIGCSGWGENQLEKEINEFTWAVLKNDNNDFAKYLRGKGNKYWTERVKELGNRYSKWLLCPTFPYLN